MFEFLDSALVEVELVHKLDDGPLEAVHSVVVIQVRHKILAKGLLVLRDLLHADLQPWVL